MGQHVSDGAVIKHLAKLRMKMIILGLDAPLLFVAGTELSFRSVLVLKVLAVSSQSTTQLALRGMDGLAYGTE